MHDLGHISWVAYVPYKTCASSHNGMIGSINRRSAADGEMSDMCNIVAASIRCRPPLSMESLDECNVAQGIVKSFAGGGEDIESSSSRSGIAVVP